MMVMAEISPPVPLICPYHTSCWGEFTGFAASPGRVVHELPISDLKWGFVTRHFISQHSCSNIVFISYLSHQLYCNPKKTGKLEIYLSEYYVAKSCSWKRWSLCNYFSRVSTYFNHPVGGARFHQWISSLKSSAWPSVLDLSAPNLEKWCVSVCHGCWTLHSESPCGIMWNCGTPKLPLWIRKILLQSWFLGLVEFGRVSLWWIITFFETPKALWVEWRH